MPLLLFIGLVCFLLLIGYFFAENAVAFTIKTLVALGALLFVVAAFFIIRSIISG